MNSHMFGGLCWDCNALVVGLIGWRLGSHQLPLQDGLQILENILADGYGNGLAFEDWDAELQKTWMLRMQDCER